MNGPVQGEDVARLRRQGAEQAIQLALESKWEEAVSLNRNILAVYDEDVDAWIVTGKRWLSHGMEYPENDRDDPPVVAWFKLVRKSGGQVEFVPYIINNYAGIGTQISVADMNGDKRPDVLTAQRKGAYLFFNNVTPSKERTTSSR